MTPPKKRISEMSDDEKRIAIAEAAKFVCGRCSGIGSYLRYDARTYGRMTMGGSTYWRSGVIPKVQEAVACDHLTRDHIYEGRFPAVLLTPDYLTDLNAMHEAEKCLTKDQQRKYDHFLWTRSQKGTHWDSSIHVTAQNRARAYLLTLGHEN